MGLIWSFICPYYSFKRWHEHIHLKSSWGFKFRRGGLGPGGWGKGSVYGMQLFDGHLGLMTQQKFCVRAWMNKTGSPLVSEIGTNVNRHWPCVSLSLSVLQEITLHAPLPPGLCGPMAGHQQEVSNLSGWHRNTAEPWQLMRFQPHPLHSCQSPSCGSCFIPPRLAGPPPCWVLCQMSPDFMWHHHPSDSRFTEPSQDN